MKALYAILKGNMKHKIQSKRLSALLQYSTVGFLIAGMVALSSASFTTISAASTGQGSTVTEMEWVADEETYHEAAPVGIGTTASMQLAIGSLLVLLGFMTHALLVLQKERTVPVRTGKHGKPLNVWIAKWYWMEVGPRRK